MQKHKLRGSQQKWLAPRQVLSGYPVTEPFKSREELDRYFSDDEALTCLLCGQRYKNLGIHTKRIHQKDSDDYRKMYGIPKAYSLICGQTKDLYHQKGIDPENMVRIADLHKLRGPSRQKRGHLVPIVKMEMAARVNAPSIDRKTYNDFSWHLAIAQSVYDCRQVIPPPGTASWSAFKKRRSKDAELSKAYHAARAARVKISPTRKEKQ